MMLKNIDLGYEDSPLVVLEWQSEKVQTNVLIFFKFQRIGRLQ